MMIHINEIGWAQLILIQIGAMLQVAALCTFIRESAKTPRVVPGAHEEEVAHEEEARCKLPETHQPAQVVHYHRELHGVMEETPGDIQPGKLAKTAKVNFKQTFKAHKEERPYTPSVRW
jgi:hypothetical protein